MVRLSWLALGCLALGCGGSSGGESGNDTGRIGEGSSGGAGSGMGGSDVATSGGGGVVAAGSGGTVDGETAAGELSQNAEALCAAACEKSVECLAQGSSSLPECAERCLGDATAAAESEECAELLLAAIECIVAAECAGLEITCSGPFEEATRCWGGRMCSISQPDLAGPPSPGDVMCSQRCEASATTPEQETRCAYGEPGWTCTCTQAGEALPDVMAESCEAAFELCFQ